MAEILSQDEIDKLLAALTSGEVTPDELREEEKAKRVRIYDFRRPNKFSKEQINSFEIIYDNFARTMATFLSAQLRISVQVSVISVEQLTYEEFVRSLPDPSVLIVFSMNPLQGNGILELQPSVVFSMIERLFGGYGGSVVGNRALTEIERTIVERVAQQMLDIFREVWATNITEIHPHVELIESNPQFAQIVSPSEMVILISLSTKIGQTEGISHFCLPYIVLEPVLDRLSAHYWFAKDIKGEDPEQRNFLQRQIESTSIPIRVVLGRTSITVQDLLAIQVGDVVPVDRRIDHDIDVYIGNRRKFVARPGRRSNRLAVQITGFVGKEGCSIEL